MAAIALIQRDLADTRARLETWFNQRFDVDATVSELTAANRAAGWSSESLLFTADVAGTSSDHVLRIPPSGGGIFPAYDLEAQTHTQEFLHDHGIATPSPIVYEPDEAWIDSRFLVMPRIVGRTPADTSYVTRGWLHDVGPQVQRRVQDSFLETLAALQRVPIDDATWLHRPTGTGVSAELTWWQEYAAWGSGNQIPDVMTEAFDWLHRHQPEQTGGLALCWNDARLSNCIFDDAGEVIGVLDWEQASLCPAETDFAWWLATRRQMLEVNGIESDPELPGFETFEQVTRHFEELIGRELVALDWYEIFAMARMGCCIMRTQTLLRSIGQGDHFLTRAPILPAWTVAAIRA